MVVPSDEPRTLGMHGLQTFFTSVQCIPITVIGQAVDPAARGQTHRIGSTGIFVNVVTQEQHQV